MRVYLYPSDRWGVGSYRMRFPGYEAAAQGHDVIVVEPEDRAVRVDIDPRTKNAVSESFPQDADVIVLQRPTNLWLSQVVPMLRARGVAVVVDMDDDLSAIHGQNPAFKFAQPKVRGEDGRIYRNPHTFHNATQACRDATLVTTSTPELARRYGAGHGRTVVLRNCVPAWYLDVPHVDNDTVGWGGSVYSHPGDLQTMGGAIAQLVQGGGTFRTVGEPDGLARALGLVEDPPCTGPVPMDEWPAAIAQFGIGVAPIKDTRFNMAKSWLKPLEYASVGVPWVGSDLGEYKALHTLGCGMVASRPAQWLRQLRWLVAEPNARADLSEAGREVASAWTFEGNVWRWVDAWAKALELQRGRAAAAAGV